jgi:uncharacterized protein YkwD
VKHILVALLLMTFQVHGQGSVVLADRPLTLDRKVDSSIWNPLQRQAAFQVSSARAKDAMYWINVLRKDPQGFDRTYLKPFLQQFPEAQSPEAVSLGRDLQVTPTLKPLQPLQVLLVSAQDQADYLAKKGVISHTGKGGKSFQKRMEDAGIQQCAGENLFDGQDDALLSLILLLIDKGVPGAGHRQALLNPQFTQVGIGISYMPEGRMVLVQQFSCTQQ